MRARLVSTSDEERVEDGREGERTGCLPCLRDCLACPLLAGLYFDTGTVGMHGNGLSSMRREVVIS
jgi:hypothetical protein